MDSGLLRALGTYRPEADEQTSELRAFASGGDRCAWLGLWT